MLSESNTRREMQMKRQEYFASGTRLVWEIDIETRSVDIYTDPQTFTRLAGDARLSGGNVLSGFEVSLTELFSVLDQTAPENPRTEA